MQKKIVLDKICSPQFILFIRKNPDYYTAFQF